MAANVDSEKKYLEKEAVFVHLDKIVDRVITEKPADAHKLIEVFSRMIKDPQPHPEKLDLQDMEKKAKYVKKLKKLDQVPTDGEAPLDVCAIPDFMEEAEMLSWAGVGFGELESYKILCSLRRLAAKEKESGLSKLRLWGKVFGTQKDYYIAEAQQDGGGEGEGGEEGDEDPPEPPGVGANAYTYYVTNDVCADWTKLPNLKPREIVAARQIKKLMTGSLDAKVTTHPHFPGNEAVLLRAQIARITADTVLCINGFLRKEGDEEPFEIKETPPEEFVLPLPAEQAKLSGWTHMQPHILLNGKTSHKEPPEEEEGNDEVNEARRKALLAIEQDPLRDPLRGIDDDGLKWTVKQAGDTCLYRSGKMIEGKEAPPRSSAVTFVQSLSWPGAVSVARNGHFANLYVGQGLPTGGPDFFPVAPPDVQDEPEEGEDEPEPQGTEEKEATGEGEEG